MDINLIWTLTIWLVYGVFSFIQAMYLMEKRNEKITLNDVLGFMFICIVLAPLALLVRIWRGVISTHGMKTSDDFENK